MKKVYYLSSCDTCKRVMENLEIPDNYILQDIKKKPISEEELDELYFLSGSYESLFSRRAKLYRERDLKNKNLKEKDYKNLILEHYTFLKRPIVLNNKEIFIGSNIKTVDAAKKSLQD